MLKLPGEDQFILFGKESEIKPYLKEGHFQLRAWNANPYNPFSLRFHPVNQLAIELFHCPHYNLPLGIKCPSIVTVHDLIPLVRPDLLPDRKAHWYASWMLPHAARRAVHILTVSEYTKQDIVRCLKIPDSKVTVIYNGVGEAFRLLTKDEKEAFRLSRGLPNRFVLFVGLLKPHKNIVRLLQAFGSLRVKGLTLLLVGRRDRRYHELNRALSNGPLNRNVIHLSHFSYEDLPLLYNTAECLVLPSLYEGFGLPVLEAMACGTPVVCSQATSLPEVVRDAAFMVDPLSVDSIKEGIERGLRDDSYRSEKIKRGFVRAKQFRWQDTAAKTFKAYHEAANQ
jgi:glycosyltransferase involved in cell wall biosynthesis